MCIGWQDQDCDNRISECQQKVKEHLEAGKKFQAFYAMFGCMNLDYEVKLNADDVLYFNVNNADVVNVEE